MYWPEVMKKDKCDEVMKPASDEVKRRRLEMLGHVARSRIPAYSRTLEKALTEERKRARPRATLINTIKSDLVRTKTTWEEIKQKPKPEYRHLCDENYIFIILHQ